MLLLLVVCLFLDSVLLREPKILLRDSMVVVCRWVCRVGGSRNTAMSVATAVIVISPGVASELHQALELGCASGTCDGYKVYGMKKLGRMFWSM